MKTLNQTPGHPANEELAAFALGKELANAETIAEHIANCSRCETLVANTPRDTFLGILNKAKPGSSLTGPNVPSSVSPTADELPEELRQQTKYTFLKKLGGGGMGVVYLAEHNLMKRKVAVKLIPPEMIGNPAVRERFLQEVVSAAALEHPNVVRAYSAEEFGEHMVFEMEFVDGLDLGKVVKSKGPLPVNFAVNYIRQAAQALQHGMLKSLVHRDIKPGNLMLTRAGSVKVADFGLAKFSRESEKARDRSLTGTNAMMGTPDYMAPEQARNAKSADIRADIYSLGCTFYFLLTGQPPFAGESLTDLIFKHWEDPRPDVGLLRNDVPKELSQFIQQMMAKEPGDRAQTPKEVVDLLTKFAKGEVEKKVPVESPKEEVVVPAKRDAPVELTFEEFSSKPSNEDLGVRQRRPKRKKKLPIIAGVFTCLLVGFAIMAATLVFKLMTKIPFIKSDSANFEKSPTVKSFVEPKIKPTADATNLAPSKLPAQTKLGPAPTPAEVAKVYLSELNPFETKDWTKAPPIPKGFGPESSTGVLVKGVNFPHGIFMHPPLRPNGGTSRISYRLDKKFAYFATEVSMNDGPTECKTGVTFNVYGDDRVIWKSKVLHSQADAQTCTISVKEIQVLTIEVDCPGHPAGALAVWLNPLVSR